MEPLGRGPEDVELIDRLRRTNIAQLWWAIGGQQEQRHSGQACLYRRRVQLGCRGTRRSDHRHRSTGGGGQAEGEERRRPLVEMSDGGTRRLVWPATRAHALIREDADHDLVVITGDEPNMRWKTYTRSIGALLMDADVEFVVSMSSFIGQVAHTRPVPLVGVATDPALVERHGLIPSRYEGPTGIVAVMLEACREVGIPALSVWAATPHYLAANPNPMAMLALLDKASEVMEVPIDTSELASVATEFERRVNEAMAENDEFVGYVRRLEAQGPSDTPIDPAGTEHLISEIEDFLKGR